jgi:predicted nucleotide-binding protein
MTARRRQEPQPIQPKVFTIEEIDAGTRKLRRRIEEVQGLNPSEIRFDDARVKTAETNLRETIREVFGASSPEFHDHQYHDIWHGGYNLMDDDHIRQQKFAAGIGQTVTMLEGLIGRLEEKRQDLAGASQATPMRSRDVASDSRRIFLVHGHDEEAKQTVARFLERLRLEPIILSERPNEGRTVIEKFEANADVGFAVVLLTPDDMGYAREEPDKARPRARQNVILELGYFVGRLLRSHVCALSKGSIEIPSDYHGVLYIPMDEAGGWKLKLASEIKQSGIEVDLNLGT